MRERELFGGDGVGYADCELSEGILSGRTFASILPALPCGPSPFAVAMSISWRMPSRPFSQTPLHTGLSSWPCAMMTVLSGARQFTVGISHVVTFVCRWVTLVYWKILRLPEEQFPPRDAAPALRRNRF